MAVSVFLMFSLYTHYVVKLHFHMRKRGRRGRARMVVGLITNCAISAYHH
jgi:hypothetical protein